MACFSEKTTIGPFVLLFGDFFLLFLSLDGDREGDLDGDRDFPREEPRDLPRDEPLELESFEGLLFFIKGICTVEMCNWENRRTKGL